MRINSFLYLYGQDKPDNFTMRNIQIDTINREIIYQHLDGEPRVVDYDLLTRILPIYMTSPMLWKVFFAGDKMFKTPDATIQFGKDTNTYDTPIWYDNVSSSGYMSPGTVYFGLIRPLKRGIFTIAIEE